MNAHRVKLAVEALEDRSVPSTMVTTDFNNDGRVDMGAITGQKTITVSLANSNGVGYTVAATLTAQKPIESIGLYDLDGDGKLDLFASGTKPSGDSYSYFWLSNGDGTFDYVEPWHPHGPKWRGF